jgi:hypothetical protein
MATQRNILCGLIPRYTDHYRIPKAGDESYLAEVTLDAATGAEVGFDIQVTTNKAAGNDTALVVNQTDTASGGTSKLIDLQSDGASVFSVDNLGNVVDSTTSTKAVVFEDFLGTWTASETLNADMWSTTAGSGTANAAATTVANSLNGEVTITTSSANASSAADASNFTGINLGYKANQGGLAVEARLQIDDIANGYVFVGFSDTISTTVERPIFLTTTAIDSDATNARGVCFDSGGTTEQWFHGGVKAGTDTAPAYSGTAPVNDTYVILRVEVSAAGAVQGFVNGVAIGVPVAAAVTITTALTPAIVVSNSTANTVIMTLDYIRTEQNR